MPGSSSMIASKPPRRRKGVAMRALDPRLRLLPRARGRARRRCRNRRRGRGSHRRSARLARILPRIASGMRSGRLCNCAGRQVDVECVERQRAAQDFARQRAAGDDEDPRAVLAPGSSLQRNVGIALARHPRRDPIMSSASRDRLSRRLSDPLARSLGLRAHALNTLLCACTVPCRRASRALAVSTATAASRQ